MAFQNVQVPIIDLQARAWTRILKYFKELTVVVFPKILEALISEVQALETAIEQVQQQRMPSQAAGKNLDAIGRIVGQERVLFDYSLISWFSPDSVGQSVDQAPVWVRNAPLFNNLIVDDSWYRLFILAKINKNMSRVGSVPEIQEIIKIAFGINISFLTFGPMQGIIIIPYNTPLYLLNILFAESGEFNKETTATNSLLPYPMTVGIAGLFYLPKETFFAPDMGSGHQVDQGQSSIMYRIH